MPCVPSHPPKPERRVWQIAWVPCGARCASGHAAGRSCRHRRAHYLQSLFQSSVGLGAHDARWVAERRVRARGCDSFVTSFAGENPQLIVLTEREILRSGIRADVLILTRKRSVLLPLVSSWRTARCERRHTRSSRTLERLLGRRAAKRTRHAGGAPQSERVATHSSRACKSALRLAVFSGGDTEPRNARAETAGTFPDARASASCATRAVACGSLKRCIR